MEQIYINLTAHTINEVTTGLMIPRSGIIARVKQETYTYAEHAGVPVYKSVFGEVQGLPEEKKGVMYIVSALTLNAIPSHRKDIVAPGNLQRDENGQPVGCVGFRAKD